MKGGKGGRGGGGRGRGRRTKESTKSNDCVPDGELIHALRRGKPRFSSRMRFERGQGNHRYSRCFRLHALVESVLEKNSPI